MPLFEYVCRSCGQQFEELVFGDAKPSCPKCRAAEPEKVLSVVSVGRAEAASPGPFPGCGRCGDPRGPGACGMS